MKKFSSPIGLDTYLDILVNKSGITLRDKLFAILSSDVEISGTELEGFDTVEFCRFLLKLHISLKKKNPAVYKIMLPLIPAIKEMIKIDEQQFPNKLLDIKKEDYCIMKRISINPWRLKIQSCSNFYIIMET